MEQEVADTAAWLASPEALALLQDDPYWPKWHGPWWRATLLWELGRADAIPRAIAEAWAAALDRDYLPFFPLTLDEVPPGRDPVMEVMCHCGLGTAVQVLAACGVAPPAWWLPWFVRYQLPDGGWNCDEAVYTRATPRSSVVSTLPALEALLAVAPRPLAPEVAACLDRGAGYLLARRLWRSLSKAGAVIEPAWARPCFPRFYFYDLLRGLRFVTRWAEARGRTLPREAVAEAVEAVEAATRDGAVAPGRRPCVGAGTRLRVGGAWTKGQEASFPLLDRVSREGVASAVLTAEWAAVRERLAAWT